MVVSIVLTAVTGPIYGRWEWHEIAAGFLILGALVLAALVEFMRPRNPYKYFNPLYGMLNTPPAGFLDNGGWEWTVNCVPPIALAIALVMLF